MKLKMIAMGLGLALVTSHAASAQTARIPHNYDTVIQGLGEQKPNAKNLSKSPDFQVFKFNKNGVVFFQIHDNTGNILAAVGIAGNESFVVPVGSLARSQIVLNEGVTAAATTSATCPCSAQVVYDDPTTRIIVIYGANGQVIQVVVIDKRKTTQAQ